MTRVEDIKMEAIENLQEPAKSKKETIEYLKSLTGLQFEEFWAELKRRDGYAAKETQASGDRGIDVVASRRVTSEGRHITLSQTKCYSDRISSSNVEKYDYLIHYAHEVEFVTTADYSKKTKRTAEEIGITLIGPDDIFKLIIDTNSWDLLTTTPHAQVEHTRPASVGVMIGLVLGAAGIRHNPDALRPLDESTDPIDAFVGAIMALLDHGFIDLEELIRFNPDEGEPIFVRTGADTERELNLPGILIPINDDWSIHIPENASPDELMKLLLALIRRIGHHLELNFPQDNSVWY